MKNNDRSVTMSQGATWTQPPNVQTKRTYRGGTSGSSTKQAYNANKFTGWKLFNYFRKKRGSFNVPQPESETKRTGRTRKTPIVMTNSKVLSDHQPDKRLALQGGGQQKSRENITQTSPGITSAEAHQKPRGRNKATGAANSNQPKEDSQQLPEETKPAPAGPPNPLKIVISRGKPKNPTLMAMDDTPRRKEDSSSKHTLHSRVLILSWESDHDAINISTYLMGDQSRDWPCVALSTLTKDSEWTSPVDQSSIVILYSTPRSQRPLYKMGRYLEYCTARKGPEKVIVVIGEDDNVKEEWTTKWEETQFSKTLKQFRISRADLDWLSRKEMLRKIEKIRESLIIHTGPPGTQTASLEISPLKNQMATETSKKRTTTLNPMEKTQKPEPTVGFLSWSPKADSQWLLELLQPPCFQGAVGDILYIHVDQNENKIIMEKISKIPSLILHFTQKSFSSFCAQTNSSGKFLLHCEKKTIVVIDDLDGKISERVIRERYKKSSIGEMSADLFLFWKEEKQTDYLTHLTRDEQDNQEAENKWNLFQDLIAKNIVHPDPPRAKLGTVGIFSRSSRTDYEWLARLLKSDKLVDDVRPFYISNRGYVEFYEEVTRCDFGILYHTKNRGRVNITNVTDSLYDLEIEYLSMVLGRYKVLVIIDDLKDSSWKEKKRILMSQPDILKYTRNLILVTLEEKKDEEKLLNKLMEEILSPALEEEEGTLGNENNADTLGNGNVCDTLDNGYYPTVLTSADAEPERHVNDTLTDGKNPDTQLGGDIPGKSDHDLLIAGNKAEITQKLTNGHDPDTLKVADNPETNLNDPGTADGGTSPDTLSGRCDPDTTIAGSNPEIPTIENNPETPTGEGNSETPTS